MTAAQPPVWSIVGESLLRAVRQRWPLVAGLAIVGATAGGITAVLLPSYYRLAQHADKGAVSVRFANGEVRTRGHGLFGSDPKPGPGSEVFVPAEDPSARRTDHVALFAAIAQILASAVTIVVVATKL